MIKNFHLKLLVSDQEGDNFFNEKDKFHPVGASKLASVLGVGRYQSKNMLWNILAGRKKQKRFESQSARRGREEEPKSARFFSQLMGVRLYTIGTKCYPQDTRLCASPDRLFTNPYTKEREGLELKNPDTSPIPSKLEPKDMIQYLLQCILNMEVFEREYWHLFYYDRRTGEYSWFKIKRNKEFFNSYILPKVQKFFKSIEEGKEPPDRMKTGKGDKIISKIIENHFIELLRYHPPEIKI